MSRNSWKCLNISNRSFLYHEQLFFFVWFWFCKVLFLNKQQKLGTTLVFTSSFFHCTHQGRCGAAGDGCGKAQYMSYTVSLSTQEACSLGLLYFHSSIPLLLPACLPLSSQGHDAAAESHALTHPFVSGRQDTDC